MKKLLFVSILVLVVFNACDDIPSEVVDSSDPDFRVLAVNAPSEFINNSMDSVLTTSISFENTSTISSVWFNVVTEDGSATLKQRVAMTDDGSSTNGDNKADDGIYTGKTILGSSVASGTYVIDYYAENNVRAGSDKVQLVSSHTLKFISSKDNVAPVLSNLVFSDTTLLGEQFVFTVDAADENGYTDIARVYYEVFDPDGNQLENSQGIKEFPMFDDGTTGGDAVSQDGTFTVALSFPASFSTGDYRFELTAEDRSGSLSNTIIHTLTVE